MATTLVTTLSMFIKHVYTNPLDLSDPVDRFSLKLSDSMANGTGTDQADIVWHDQRTVTAAVDSLDLAGGLTNPITGAAITWVTIKGFAIHNLSTTTTETLLVGGAAANPFINWVSNATDEVVVNPNGILFVWSPLDSYAVTAGTGDILQIDPTAATITYDIWIVGTSA